MFCSLDACPNDKEWYLIHCKFRKEFYVATRLKNQLKLLSYFPQYERRIQGTMQQLPLFPGYIFIQADLQKTSLTLVNSTPGVIRLVNFGGEPQPIPHWIIEEIEECAKTLGNVPNHSFQSGEIVRVKQKGPLQNLEMVFVGPATPSQRVRVLLSFLGRMKEIHIDAEALEKVSHTPGETDNSTVTYPHRERYTRGKGRKIKH